MNLQGLSIWVETGVVIHEYFALHKPNRSIFHSGSAVKNPPVMWKLQVWSLDQEGPLEEGLATHSSILTWRIPWRGTWWIAVHGVSKSRTQLGEWHNWQPIKNKAVFGVTFTLPPYIFCPSYFLAILSTFCPDYFIVIFLTFISLMLMVLKICSIFMPVLIPGI